MDYRVLTFQWPLIGQPPLQQWLDRDAVKITYCGVSMASHRPSAAAAVGSGGNPSGAGNRFQWPLIGQVPLQPCPCSVPSSGSCDVRFNGLSSAKCRCSDLPGVSRSRGQDSKFQWPLIGQVPLQHEHYRSVVVVVETVSMASHRPSAAAAASWVAITRRVAKLFQWPLIGQVPLQRIDSLRSFGDLGCFNGLSSAKCRCSGRPAG